MAKIIEVDTEGLRAWIASAKRTLTTENEALAKLIAALDGPLGIAFGEAVRLIKGASGRVVVTGMGKSGHIGRKIAATLASTGTQAFFVHPAEAGHGDLGMIGRDDVIIMISNSGETAELRAILDYAKRFDVKIIGLTSRAESTLSTLSDVSLCLPDAREACPIGMAPTTSTLLQLAMGDALALALLEDRGFNAAQFKTFHPGGLLGAALTHVREIMHKAPRLPIVAPATPMAEALVIMTQKSLGCLGVVDDAGKLIGILTDGDLRRHMSRDLIDLMIADVMTSTPRTITSDMLASEALEHLNSSKITALFVVDDENRPIGLVHVHDLLRQGVK
ncbi:KpsF/GutQ family sugar-phosphate isomerase [Taklimakanibacter deserti]|uniref:KpsF/GutQ family sugar-phosphate isomerase n=1 Tax=Taklimakanibacter deserti TaxID=2267839 RepID=UPI000E658A5A